MSLEKIPIIAIIPARGGSKSVPFKNMKKINNKPLIFYTINAAIKSKFIDEVYVSSDNNKILNYCNKFKLNCIIRPKYLSGDKVTAVKVLWHAIKKIDKKLINKNPYLIYLQPTSPLRNQRHIDDMISNLKRLKKKKAVSVVETNETPYKTFKIDYENKLKSIFNQKYSNYNRQYLPKTYKPNGAIYFFKLSQFIKQNSFPSNGSYPYIMNKKNSIDIDNNEDLLLARKYLK
tara:strand:+ start:304 stop:999 length:696 start_codon:yes stop_codon:yes gene_type:complete